MSYVEYASEGRLLFRAEAKDGVLVVPRVQEVVMVDDLPYMVVDVEYWARRVGTSDRRTVIPTVYVLRVDDETWQRRLERRIAREPPKGPKLRY